MTNRGVMILVAVIIGVSSIMTTALLVGNQRAQARADVVRELLTDRINNRDYSGYTLDLALEGARSGDARTRGRAYIALGHYALWPVGEGDHDRAMEALQLAADTDREVGEVAKIKLAKVREVMAR